jgi:subtilisin-like proprotein convertase family protein
VNDDDMDGICNEFEVPGCMDIDACNFTMEATDDDGNCIYAEEFYDCGGACLNDEDGDGVCDELEIPGCQDTDACNYMPLATDDDDSCEYAEEFYDCDGECLMDSDGDGVCDELEIPGCTDELACNYSMEATEDDDSCEFAAEYYGCDGECLMDTDGDGVCDELEIPGCTDEMACNYSMDATDDDGMCEYAEEFYNCAGECLMDADGDGVCDELEVTGCIDEMACNYNVDATDDDSSCEYAEQYYDCEGMCVNDQDGDGICDEVDDCDGVLDECGVCGGPGAVYECGCSDIPEGDCDCDGNQLDAVGVCGGNCILDSNEDGICDCYDNEGLPIELGDALTCFEIPFQTFGLSDTAEVTLVSANMEHSFMGDLNITLICPNGQELVLSSNPGSGVDLGEPEVDGTGPGIGYDYAWSEDAELGTFNEEAENVSAGESLPAGTYSSEGAWTSLDGCPSNGVWVLEICDAWAADNGYLFEAGISFGDVEFLYSEQLGCLPGCTDQEACNFNPTALEDDGSCVYPGDACDDGDENTINDTIDENCDCVGEVEDGVEEARLAFGMFPNPTTGEVTLTVAGFHTGVTVQVLDGAGRVVWTEQNVALEGNTVLDLSGLSSGTYNVMLSDERGVSVQRLAIQR